MSSSRAGFTVDRVLYVLLAATILTTWGMSALRLDPSIATMGVLVIAAWKVWLVMIHFMELGRTSWVPRLVATVWIVVVVCVIGGFYLGASR